MSFTTATCAPTPTKPPPPAKPIGVECSSMPAETVTAPPASIVAYSETPASVRLLTFSTSTEPPTPTNPPAAAPAIPNTKRTSFATTLTWPPATTVVLWARLESIVAVVPPVGTWAIAFVAMPLPTPLPAAVMLDCGPRIALLMRELVMLWLSALAHCFVFAFGVFTTSAGRVMSSLAVYFEPPKVTWSPLA